MSGEGAKQGAVKVSALLSNPGSSSLRKRWVAIRLSTREGASVYAERWAPFSNASQLWAIREGERSGRTSRALKTVRTRLPITSRASFISGRNVREGFRSPLYQWVAACVADRS